MQHTCHGHKKTQLWQNYWRSYCIGLVFATRAGRRGVSGYHCGYHSSPFFFFFSLVLSRLSRSWNQSSDNLWYMGMVGKQDDGSGIAGAMIPLMTLRLRAGPDLVSTEMPWGKGIRRGWGGGLNSGRRTRQTLDDSDDLSGQCVSLRHGYVRGQVYTRESEEQVGGEEGKELKLSKKKKLFFFFGTGRWAGWTAFGSVVARRGSEHLRPDVATCFSIAEGLMR